MPPGTPYHSFVLPYRIRVDSFATPPGQDIQSALHLLTHTHTDHINGLSAKSFGHRVICSHDAKEMLLRHEVYDERQLKQNDLRAESVRTFAHLKVDPVPHQAYYQGSRDLLKTIHLHTPTEFELSDNEHVTITALDANHCPGSVMFLIEGSQGAVLHTGDFRAEPWFLESLSRNPYLQPYLDSSAGGILHRGLDCIYLDTACAFSSLDIPSKSDATTGLIELMKLFPPDVYFYVNAWTWGYEEILKAISTAFQSKIHVDRYKYNIYQSISDPYMRLIVTRDPQCTRFHACERFNRCDHVFVDNEDNPCEVSRSRSGKRVIYINAVTMESSSWDLYLQVVKQALMAGDQKINDLLVPLSRHSTLPELRAFVRLFRPKRVIPNTLEPSLQGLDWLCIDRMFEDCVSGPTNSSHRLTPFLSNPLDQDEDLGVKNAIGSDKLASLFLRWADSNSIRRKLEVARQYLKPPEKVIVDRVLGAPGKTATSSNSGKGKVVQRTAWSDDDTDDDDDDTAGRTAHILFASQAGIDENAMCWWMSSPASQKGQTRGPQSSPFNAGPQLLDQDSAALPLQIPQNLLPPTPTSSPSRATKNTLRHQKPQSSTPTTTRRFRKPLKGSAQNAKGDLDSPIALGASSPDHTMFSLPMSESKTILPKRDAIKFPLTERGNRMSTGSVDLLVSSMPQSDPGDNPPRYQKVELPVIHENITPNSKRLGGRVGPLLSPEGKGSHRTLALPRRSSSPQPRSSSPQKQDQRVRDYLRRIEIGQRLAESRPAAVVHSYSIKRARLIEKCSKLEAKKSHSQTGHRVRAEGPSSSLLISEPTVVIPDVDDECNDNGMDWNRSRDLAEAVRAALVNGERVLLPALKCADSQSSQYAFR